MLAVQSEREPNRKTNKQEVTRWINIWKYKRKRKGYEQLKKSDRHQRIPWNKYNERSFMVGQKVIKEFVGN